DDGAQKGGDQSRSGKSGGAVAKPVLYIAGPEDHWKREPETHPEFVPKHGHRVPCVLGVARMLTYIFRVLAVIPVHPYFTGGGVELVERLIIFLSDNSLCLMSLSEHLLPNRTPVHLTFTLALELFPAAAHSSSTFRAHPIQNAGDHIGSRFDRTQSDKPHTSPHPAHRMIRHRESRSGGEAPQNSVMFRI